MRAAALAVALLVSCAPPPAPTKPPPPRTIVLWVWDRADDLRFLQPGEAEVAAGSEA